MPLMEELWPLPPCPTNSAKQMVCNHRNSAQVKASWVPLLAEMWSSPLACNPPAVTLSQYIPAFATAQVKAGLVPLLAELRSKGMAPSDAWLKGDYDTDKQVGLGEGGWCLWVQAKRAAACLGLQGRWAVTTLASRRFWG